MTSLTADQLNYMVFRYLQESGFIHTAFNFGYEAGVNNCSIDGNMVPPGALVTFVQKGIQYLEMEANLNDNDTDLDVDFSFITPLDLLTKDAYQLKQIIEEKKNNQQKAADEELAKEHEKESELAIDRGKQIIEEKREKRIKRANKPPKITIKFPGSGTYRGLQFVIRALDSNRKRDMNQK